MQGSSKTFGKAIREAFGWPFIANQELDRNQGEALLAAGEADAISYGRLFIANPDLPRRFALSAPLNTPLPETFYGAGSEGYTNYPPYLLPQS